MNFKNPEPISSKLFRFLWGIVSFIPFNLMPRPFGIKTRYYLLLLFGAKLGKNVIINNKVKIYNPRNLEFDDYVSIGPNVNLYSVAKIKIGTYTVVSQYSELLTASHDYTKNSFDLIKKEIIIGENCWLSYGVLILPGIVLNNHIVCASRSVVVKSFLDQNIVIGGNPALFIKKFKIND